MLRRAMTRTIFTGCSDSGNDRLGRQLEPGGEVDLRLVSKRLACRGDVGPRVVDVAGARRLEAFFDRLAEDEADRLRNVIHARGGAGRDVEDASAGSRRVRSPDGCIDDIPDVREVARLLAVAVDGDRLARVDCGDEERDRGRVLGVRALPRTEDVEVPQHDRFEGVVDAAEADAVALRGELRHAVR